MVAFVLPFKRINTKESKPNTALSNEAVLIKGLLENQELAMQQLYHMYAPALHGIITRIVKFDEIAEDILQDTFLKIWKSIGQYDPYKGRLFTWMANLAKNTAIDQIRSKAYSNAVKTDDLHELSSTYLDSKNNFQLNTETIGMKQLLHHLKPDQKQIIDLFYFEGFTHIEVAKHLNIPLGTVKTKIRLSILALRQYFNETHAPLKIKRA